MPTENSTLRRRLLAILKTFSRQGAKFIFPIFPKLDDIILHISMKIREMVNLSKVNMNISMV